MLSLGYHKKIESTMASENMTYLIVSVIPVDGLVLLGARTSAVTLTTKVYIP